MTGTIKGKFQNKLSVVLKNINEIKKQDKSYIAATYETELDNILKEIEMLEIKTQRELDTN